MRRAAPASCADRLTTASRDAAGPERPVQLAATREGRRLAVAHGVRLATRHGRAAVDAAKSEAVAAALQAKFTLSRGEGERLVELTHRASRESADHCTFTSPINQWFSMGQNPRMVALMWRMADADGTLAAHENIRDGLRMSGRLRPTSVGPARQS